ncbi:MAG: alpha-galactosidase, partial [Anaerolineaceae bacterium]
MIELTNPWLRLLVEPESGSFSLFNLEKDFAWVKNARFGISVAFGSRAQTSWCGDLSLIELRGPLQQSTVGGMLDLVECVYQTKTGALDLTVSLGLLRDSPLLLQKLSLTNHDNKTIFPERLILCDLNKNGIQLTPSPTIQPVFYSNGWQSWSPAGVYRHGERQQRSRLGTLSNPMIINPGTPVTRKRDHFSSDMFALIGDTSSRVGLIAGFLSQAQQFGSLETWLRPQPTLEMWANGDRVHLLPGQTLQTDWAAYGFTDLDAPHPFQPYFEAAQRENDVRLPEKTPVGWCSWYYYFERVTAQDIRQNLAAAAAMRAEFPLDLFQIDDGYEKSVGNWLEFNQKFPEGLRPLAGEIRSAGLTPGMWLAPFIVQAGSEMLKRHPGWILRSRLGKPVNAGFAWNSLASALDLTNPDALAYVRTVIQTAVKDWGFPYLKLDFLYAAALGGKHHNPT